MNVEDLKKQISARNVLDLSNKFLTTEAVETVIEVILANEETFNLVSGVNLSGNNMAKIPDNFLRLCEYLEDTDASDLDISGNPFNLTIMESLLDAWQARVKSRSLSIRIINDDIITSEIFQRLIYTSLVHYLTVNDPEKEAKGDPELEAEMHKYVDELFAYYVETINEKGPDKPLNTLLSLTAKDIYDFDPWLLKSQISKAVTEYYSGSPKIRSLILPIL